MLESHLEECAECRAELLAERKLAREIVGLQVEPDGDWASIEQRLGTPSGRRCNSSGCLVAQAGAGLAGQLQVRSRGGRDGAGRSSTWPDRSR